MMVADPGDSANRSEEQGSQPGAVGGWRDAYRVLSLPPRRLPTTPNHLRAIYNTWPYCLKKTVRGESMAVVQTKLFFFAGSGEVVFLLVACLVSEQLLKAHLNLLIRS